MKLISHAASVCKRRTGPLLVQAERIDPCATISPMEAIETTVRTAVDLLVRGEFQALECLDQSDRVSAAKAQAAVLDYGRELAPPDNVWWDSVSITQVNDQPTRTFHVAAPLWTTEEGRSDLTLEMRLVELRPPTGVYELHIEDLHVL